MAEPADIAPSEGSEGGYGPFVYLSAPTAPLYRRIMRALMAEKERFTVHVRPQQVWAALQTDGGDPVEQGTVAEALDRLAQPGWGNLLAFPDSSRVTALEDFYRRRMLYQLSREGEAAERALAQYDAALGTRGALQSVALEDIVVLLSNLRDTVTAQAAGESVDAALTHQALRSLRERFAELANRPTLGGVVLSRPCSSCAPAQPPASRNSFVRGCDEPGGRTDHGGRPTRGSPETLL